MDRFNNFYLKGMIFAVFAMFSQFAQAQCPNISGLSSEETICETEALTITSNIQNASSILWTSDGDGVFIDENTEGLIYIFGSGDIANGTVILTVTVSPIAIWADHGDVTADVLFRITSEPYPYVGYGDGICIEDSYTINTVNINGDYSSFSWNEDGEGFLPGIGSLTPAYHSDPLDNRKVTIIHELQSESPCTGSDSDGMVLDVFNEPIANAGIAFFNKLQYFNSR